MELIFSSLDIVCYVCVCVSVCVIVMQFETTSSIIVYPKSCSKWQVLHLFQWGTYIISSVHVVPNTVWFGKAQIFQGMGIVPYILRWCQKERRSAPNPMSNSTIKTFFPLFRCGRLRIIPLLHFLVEAQVILCTLRSSDSESQLVFVCTFVKQELLAQGKTLGGNIAVTISGGMFWVPQTLQIGHKPISWAVLL